MIEKCPRCSEGEFERVELFQVQLDRCHECRGIWFDGGEFEKVVEMMHGDEAFRSVSSVESDRNIQTTAYTPLRVTCPGCRAALLHEAPISFDFIHHFVMTDRCSECRGVWLDASELALISKYIQDEEQAISHAARQEVRDIQDGQERDDSEEKRVPRRKFWRALVGLKTD